MSRVAKNPVKLPAGVEIKLAGQQLSVKGAKGALELNVHSSVEVIQEGSELRFAARNGDQQNRAMAGTTRALVNNMVIGVTDGYSRTLEIVGVGYRVIQKTPKQVEFALGFSHPVIVDAPEGITFEVETPQRFHIRGIDKQVVGEVAANIRKIRKPEPYKGKGVRYQGEHVRRKAGKAGK